MRHNQFPAFGTGDIEVQRLDTDDDEEEAEEIMPDEDMPASRTVVSRGDQALPVKVKGESHEARDYSRRGSRGEAGNSSKRKSEDVVDQGTLKNAPVDVDEVFMLLGGMEEDSDSLTGSLLDAEEVGEAPQDLVEVVRYFNNPNAALLDADASLIPGSPFSKPGIKRSTRPSEPLALARYASSLAVLATLAWVSTLLYAALWTNSTVGKIIVEVIMAVISFFGLFWNTYFIISSLAKCFIPAKAFKTNTKYCSIIPETKPPNLPWLNVTIQIPVYKESLQEVMIPTLKSCIKARRYYIKNAPGADCNIVICDDGMMAFLRDNFAAAEMLWDAITKSKGSIVKLSKLLKTVPREAQAHLRGLRSKNVYEVFHRMLFYYHTDIGFVARSTVDRRGKFKKASNLNSHLRLALGAEQTVESEGISFSDALIKEAFNSDGSRLIMFGNNVRLGHLICVNDADARMAESVILKTVPEFLNDPTLGFTQHATKTMMEQRGETYYTNMLTVYTDALYQGHFLLSSIMGCHPPLVGHSIFLRTEALKQCGRMRMLRHAERWLKNIGLPFLPVDQIGFSNLHANNRAEYWSESHVSEDFELMIHLYNLGFNGRYCAYPDCEFEEGITRTFDEEAGRHRKFALGAHELIFNPLQDMLGQGILTPLFRTFISCDIPSYYKIFLSAYLSSYTSGGTYLLVFSVAALAHILDGQNQIDAIKYFSPAGVIILNILAFYVIGYITFIISLLRMFFINKNLLFKEYRKRFIGPCHIIFVMIRYCLVFQFLFYTVASITYYFLGSMDHLLSRPNICSATNKDSIKISRCSAFYEMAKFNIGSWVIATYLGGLAITVVIQDQGWKLPTSLPKNWLDHVLFSGPALFLSLMCFISPILLNPYILGWPFVCQPREESKGSDKAPDSQKYSSRSSFYGSGKTLGLRDFMQAVDTEMDRVQRKQDVEVGTIRDLYTVGNSADSSPSPTSKRMLKRQAEEEQDNIEWGTNDWKPQLQQGKPQSADWAKDKWMHQHPRTDNGNTRRGSEGAPLATHKPSSSNVPRSSSTKKQQKILV